MIKSYIKNNKYTKISLLLLLFYVSNMFSDKGMGNNDFKCYYVALQFLQKFSLEKLYNIDAFLEFNKMYFPEANYGWFYPPHYVFQIYLFGLLPFCFANFLFVITGVLFFAGAIYCVSKKINLTQNILFYILATPFVGFTIMTSQNSLYTASFLLIGMNFLDERPVIAGLCFALMSYKPQFVILIPFALLLTKNYKTFIWAGLFFIIQLTGSIIIFGINPWIKFFETIPIVSYLLANSFLPISLMASSFATFISFGLSQKTAQLLSLIWFLGIGGVSLFIWYIRKADSLAKAILSLGICLASPYLFYYDMAILMVSVIFFMQHNNFKLSHDDIQDFFLLFIVFSILLILSIIFNINLLIILIILLLNRFIHTHKLSLKKLSVA